MFLRSYPQLEYLEDCLRDGKLPAAAQSRMTSIFSTFADSPSAAGDFAQGMLGASIGECGLQASGALCVAVPADSRP